MKRPIRLIGNRRGPVLALGLAAACCLFVAPASNAQDAASETFTATPSVAHSSAPACQVTLPGGIKATVTPGGAHVTNPSAVAGKTMLTLRSDGHQYLVPSDALTQTRTTGLAAYDTTALAQRTCGDAAVAPAAQQTPAPKPGAYTMGRLTVHTIDTTGKPGFGVVLLVSQDHTAYADKLYYSEWGSVKVSVPTGHYTAILYDVYNRFVVDPDVTVGDGTNLTMDLRDATTKVPVPSTPQPANLTNEELSLYSSDGTASGDGSGTVFQAESYGSALDAWTNTSSAPKQGRFALVTAFDYDSPAGAKKPYTYHVANTYDHVPSSYPTSVAQSSLATVDETYSAPAGPFGEDVLYLNGTPKWAATANVETLTAFNIITAGAQRTEYFSASPDFTWRTDDLSASGNVLIGPDATYRPGTEQSMTWEGGVAHPSAQIYNGSAAVYCGACASPDSLLFAMGPDGDSTPGTVGDGSYSNNVTLYRNGTLLAVSTDAGSLDGAGVTVPTGRATYKLEQQTVRSTTLAPSTDTTWTFSADPGQGKAVPSRVLCAQPVTPCVALPLLYASVNSDADADMQHQLAPGTHTVDLNVTHQQYSTTAAITGAQLQVSYDGGKSWQDLKLTGSNGTFHAGYTIPDSAVGGTVSFKLAAWDALGNRIDQVMPSAYAVR